MKLTSKQLENIHGGAAIAAATTALIWKILGLLGLGVFAIGAVDGYTNPIKCRR